MKPLETDGTVEVEDTIAFWSSHHDPIDDVGPGEGFDQEVEIITLRTRPPIIGTDGKPVANTTKIFI